MFNNKNLEILFIPDRNSGVKKLNLKRRTIIALTVLIVVFAGVVSFLGYHYYKTYNHESQVANLADKNKRLKKKISTLEENLVKTEKKLGLFENRIDKLANMIGVKDVNEKVPGGGIGGYDLKSTDRNILNNENLKNELSELQNRTSTVKKGLDEVTDAYEKKFDNLVYTPSIWPAKGVLTHGYGWRKDPFTGKPDFHKGLDISTRRGSNIVAPADGTVIDISRKEGLGKYITISHGFGIVTRYGHLKDYNVREKQKIKRGDVIAHVGVTGRSTGPHLHYEIQKKGEAVDPMDYIIDERSYF